MRTLRLLMRIGRRWTMTIGCLAIPLLFNEAVLGATVEEIREAWSRHAAAIQSVKYECEQTWVESIHKKVVSGDPFDTPADPQAKREEIKKRGTISFIRYGEKAALTRVAEQWNYERNGPVIVRQYQVYDGRNRIQLGERLASVEQASTPQHAINNSVELWPLWLAHWPADQLQRHEGFDLERMEITGDEVICGEAACIELTLPSEHNKESNYAIYVDPAKDLHIVKLISSYKGVPRLQFDVELIPDKEITWRPASWRSELANESNPEGTFIRNVVKNFAINEPIDESVFTVKFPIGTHVFDNGKYFIQEPNGTRREISEREFGAMPIRKEPL